MKDSSQRRLFEWTRGGQIYCPDGRYPWMHSHAQNPAVLPLDDRLRVYFNCRPARNPDGTVQAYPTFVDLERTNPGTVLAVNNCPILDLGDLGTFDQFGVMASSVLPVGKEIWMYYVGWSRCAGVPYHHAIGLAISQDGGITFSRFAKGPIMTRSSTEPYIQNSPFVLKIGTVFHMWYSTGTGWIRHGETVESTYVLVHATSEDGITWTRDGNPCIETRVPDECQTNPSIIELNGRYHMWFCYRCGIDFRNATRGYRIGYAWSDDLVTWFRDDSMGELVPSREGWDSQMVCYPRVVELDEKLYIFYSGNNFGESGFGYAVAP